MVLNNTKQRLGQGSLTNKGGGKDGKRKLQPRDPGTQGLPKTVAGTRQQESPSRLPPGAKHQVIGSSSILLREKCRHGELHLWNAGVQTRLKGK